MAKKEINVFSVSFLDLLSGALAAVIILLVIIPKLTSEDQEALETIEELNVQVESLDSLIQVAEDCIDESVLEEIASQLAAMRGNLEQAEERIANMERTIDNTRQRNRQLENQLVATENRIREIESQVAQAQEGPTQEELDDLQNQLAEARAELEEMRESDAAGSEGAGASMFGINAKFAVVCDWGEDLDVDLWMKNLNTGEWVCWTDGGCTKSGDWGSYLGDVTSRSTGDGRFEMIYQELEVVPGRYEVWYHLYSDSGTAMVEGYAVVHPFSPQEQKVKFSSKAINHTDALPNGNGGYKIATLNLSENGLSMN